MEEMMIRSFYDDFEEMVQEVKKRVVGQDDIVRYVLMGVIASGNVLMEGTPGLGKTVLVKTLSKVLDLPFSRIQFTPDLMPQDITGTEMIHQGVNGPNMVFEKGPIFSSLVLADEINRATPKTQSALLEAMQEKTVTVGKKTYILEEPFFVLATQNPLEMEGTYLLPEAQLDRFLFKLNIQLPKASDLLQIIDTTLKDEKPPIKICASKEKILSMKQMANQIPISSRIKEKVVQIMLNTHPNESKLDIVKQYVRCGASPRGIQAMVTAARVSALSEGRFHVAFEDIEKMAYPCLRHRIFLNFHALSDKIAEDEIIRSIIKKVKGDG